MKIGRRPYLVMVPLIAAMLVASGCSSQPQSDSEYMGYCADKETGLRVEDSLCGDFTEEGMSTHTGTYIMWISMSDYSRRIPVIGRPATVGKQQMIAPGKAVSVAPSKGGTVSRGGFGVSSSVGGKSSGG